MYPKKHRAAWLIALVKATKGVSERYNCLQDLLTLLSDYLRRLSTRIRLQVELSPAARMNALDVLVHLLRVLALATKLLKKNRFGSYNLFYAR